jgi:CRISPR-associated protein Csm4
MSIEAFKLHFTTPLHLGRGREDLDRSELIYHSDSLKSAVYATGLHLFPEWINASDFYNGIKISSCFPFSGDELFFTKPQIRKRFSFLSTDNDKAPKKSKRIEFIAISVFKKFIDPSISEIIVDERFITPDHAFLCNDMVTAKNDIYQTDVQQRVIVPKEGLHEDARPFYIDRIYFNKNCGLFFLAEFSNSNLRSQFLKALQLLGENGIGTDRTVGNGFFNLDTNIDIINGLKIDNGYNSQMKLILGLYLPTEDEMVNINLNESHWSLVKRGGFMAANDEESLRHLRRKEIYMFAEGSVLNSGMELKGKFIDLRPEWNPPLHPSWRCGMPLILNI